ncbi:hypothetical protein MPSEU_000278800 [Mayamaea pseudoterrestris]|nr:hypothetical protein MPSEU_000278800 [Mayamaea pseudoterrestris]
MPVRNRKPDGSKAVVGNTTVDTLSEQNSSTLERTKRQMTERPVGDTRRKRILTHSLRMAIGGTIAVIIVVVASALIKRSARDPSQNPRASNDEQSAAAFLNDTSAPTPSSLPQHEQPTLSPSPSTPPRVSKIGHFELLETVPHDPTAFTQGLFIWNNNTLYEGTGNYGESKLRIVDVSSGNVVKEVSLESNLFGEGISHYTTKDGTRIVQLTYKEQTGLIWDMDLNLIDTFKYETITSEGWGITYADSHGLLVSDGSEWIMVWDPESLTNKSVVRDVRRFQVQLLYKGSKNPRAMARVNEMEWDTHSKTLLANVWVQDVLVRIDVESGFVTQIYDMQELWPDRPSSVDVFNGVAITNEPNVVWVTGKWWPKMYKVRLIDG